MPILETKHLTKKFAGVHALEKLSLAFEKGKITGLVGPNGSGKSTLINALTGIIPIDGGSVIVGGAKIAKVRASEVSTYGVTRTFQEVRLFNQMSALDNILVVLTEREPFLSLFEKHTDFHVQRAEELLSIAELHEKRHELAGNLSYGQRKLLEILRALAMDTELLFLDEPFAGLSPRMIEVLKRILVQLKDGGKTVVLVEHNLDLIRELCGHVVVLDSGALLAEGEPEEVFSRQSVVDAYIGK